MPCIPDELRQSGKVTDVLRRGLPHVPPHVTSLPNPFIRSGTLQVSLIKWACEYFAICNHSTGITGRLIQKRELHELDLDAVFEAAAGAHVLMESNVFPTRLDLSDIHCRRARSYGVTMGIRTDAHHTDHLGYLNLGVAVPAGGGWKRRMGSIPERLRDCRSDWDCYENNSTILTKPK